jgi:CBS domain-containing membrane protein
VSIAKFLQALAADPVPLGYKDKIIAASACLTAIFITGQLSRIIGADPAYPLLVASMGASAVILFAIPNSPLAQPWPFAGGQLLSAFIGVVCLRLFPDTIGAAALASGFSVLFMLLLRCLHPPATATALTPVLGGEQLTRLGFDFVTFPVGINVVFMLLSALAINRLLLRRNYPLLKSAAGSATQSGSGAIAGTYNEADIVKALKGFGNFIDVSSDELSRLFTETEKLAFMRYRGDIRCSEIMRKDVISVHYATEVEDAWALMQAHKLKAMPVLGPSRHVIGIITPQDFFKYVDLNAYGHFADKFRTFIRRTPEVSSNKPEAAGHIMTRKVVTVPEDAHIAELIPLMSNHGHRHIPIVDTQQRLAGMVYQSDLVAALYHRSANEANASASI